MHKTREIILQHLKEHGSATADELAAVLKLNSVTVRHHLDVLRGQALVAQPAIRHRATPGRPQYAYSLAQAASEHFPKNYCDLAAKLLEEMRASQPPEAISDLFDGVGRRLSAAAPRAVPGESFGDRLDRATAFLNAQGYVASWELTPDGCLLRTCNCPYEALAGGNPELCSMDLTLMANLTGRAPQRLSRVAEGAACCAYLFADDEDLAPAGQNK